MIEKIKDKVTVVRLIMTEFIYDKKYLFSYILKSLKLMIKFMNSFKLLLFFKQIMKGEIKKNKNKERIKQFNILLKDKSELSFQSAFCKCLNNPSLPNNKNN